MLDICAMMSGYIFPHHFGALNVKDLDMLQQHAKESRDEENVVENMSM